MSTIYDAAKSYKDLLKYEYKIVLGYKGKAAEVPLCFNEDAFFHLCGLHYLENVAKINDTDNVTDVFHKILRKEIIHEDIVNDSGFIKNSIQDRINRVADLPNFLNNVLCKPQEADIYKYNSKANPGSSINGNFLTKSVAADNRTVYFIIRADSYNQGKYFGLSIFSRDLTDKKQRDFAIGHTHNTLLYVSKTPLVNGEPDRSKEEVLFKRSSYNGANNGNVTIVKFSQINNIGGDVAVLAPPRFSFGQALAKLINKWADKIGEGIERRKRELQIAKQENNELKKELTERDEQLAQKDEIIKELHAEKKDLTLELIEQKRLFREATHKTLDEKFAEAKQRCRERKTEKSSHLPEQRKDKYRK